jgi:hypothetical protein
MWASQMSCKKEGLTRDPPAKYVNGTKRAHKVVGSTIEMSIHERTSAQREPKVLQEMCWADSAAPHPDTQK